MAVVVLGLDQGRVFHHRGRDVFHLAPLHHNPQEPSALVALLLAGLAAHWLVSLFPDAANSGSTVSQVRTAGEKGSLADGCAPEPGAAGRGKHTAGENVLDGSR